MIDIDGPGVDTNGVEGASVVEVYKSLVDRKTTFDVNSMRSENGNF